MARPVRISAIFCVLALTIAPAGMWAQTNKGLVGVGRVSDSKKDKAGETFGSLSGLALDLRTWQRSSGGTYSGTLYTQPDRGYTKSGVTTNYRPRRQKFTLSFKPDTNGSSNQDQLDLNLTDTTLYTEASGTSLTSLDPSPTTNGTRTGFPSLPQAFNGRLSLDAEGLVLLSDGSFFVSDEYGPYLYRFSAAGVLLSAIRPPEALIPRRGPPDSFSSDSPGAGQPSPSPSQPISGRENNKGLEGLSVSADGRTLYALMQAATRQDGGAGSIGQNRYTRLLAYNITNPASAILTGEWVLPLPFYTDSSNVQQIAEQHELVALNSRLFLVIASDGNGRGADVTASRYRKVVLYDINSATNIAGSTYDAAGIALATNGVLASNVTAAPDPTVLVDLNDTTQLNKFGLNNSSNSNSDTLASKWESLALAPALDPTTPDDFFLLIGNDNDFSTSDGFQDSVSYNASPNVDTMVLAYRVTLPGTLTVPSIVTQPTNVTSTIGQNVTLNVTALGNPSPTYQWAKNGVNIDGATSTSLSLPNAQSTATGTYAVTITNANGSVTSSAASVTVNAVNAPAFSAQPVSQTIAIGSTVVFSAPATNSPSYLWRRDGVIIANATGPTLVISGAKSTDAGNYTSTATNSFGTATSTAALLTVVSTTAANVGRLINLSILTPITPGETMTMGTVLGGTGTSGNKALLARAAGPSLTQLGVTGVLPDPKLVVIAKSTGLTLDSNNDWGGSSTLANAFAQVGAFAYASSSSKDAAVVLPALPAGDYTVQISDNTGASGTVIAELYDSTPSSAVVTTTPRLINVSVLKQIPASTTLIAGFVIGGTTAKTVLVRAIGPGLNQFGVPGTMVDPQLMLFRGQTKILENDNWGGDAQITAVGNSVAAFAITSATSKDAMLLVTLSPDNYSAQVSGLGGGGQAIVEVYEIP